jgi:hypothetical protein
MCGGQHGCELGDEERSMYTGIQNRTEVIMEAIAECCTTQRTGGYFTDYS